MLRRSIFSLNLAAWNFKPQFFWQLLILFGESDVEIESWIELFNEEVSVCNLSLLCNLFRVETWQASCDRLFAAGGLVSKLETERSVFLRAGDTTIPQHIS
jgi:hypothetical protein